MKSKVIRWTTYHPDDLFVIRRVNVTRANEGALHGHDFAEVFWCCQGAGAQIVNGRRHALQTGDLCMIRPIKDIHVIQGQSPDFMIVNVAFPCSILNNIRRRYYGSAAFWGGDGPLPGIYHLMTGEHQWLNAMANELLNAPQNCSARQIPECGCTENAESNKLPNAPRNRLALDRFILNLLASAGPSLTDPYRACPAWLRNACDRMQQPDHLKTGVHALFELAGRSQEHVARMLKKHTGKTPTAIVNDARMAYASGQLQTTTREILDIAMDCGFDSLSHFYALFHRAFGLSPRHYRLTHFKAPIHPPFHLSPHHDY